MLKNHEFLLRPVLINIHNRQKRSTKIDRFIFGILSNIRNRTAYIRYTQGSVYGQEMEEDSFIDDEHPDGDRYAADSGICRRRNGL